MSNRELFVRSKENPILTKANWPYPVSSVFNPGAVWFEERVLLLARVQDMRGYSHLTVAKSRDGETDWQIYPKPTLEPSMRYKENKFGFEDPRVVWLEERQAFVITCVSFDAKFDGAPTISLIETKNFRDFKRLGRPLRPEDKDGSLFPRTIRGNYVLMSRPVIKGKPYIVISFSPDLISWYEHRPLLAPREGMWDEAGVGLGPPPIWTPQGWLIIYHGLREKASKLVYRVGLALLDLERLQVAHRSEGWVFEPEKDYEGGEDGIVFPCGTVVNKDTREIKLYYGANDSKIALATGNLDKFLEFLMKCPAE